MAELSPAARAVMKAFKEARDGHYVDGEWIQDYAGQVAAALEALADQDETLFNASEELMPAVRAVRTDRILAIAAELRGEQADG